MELVLQGIQKNFDKKQVLKNATFTFEQGKIYGLIGRNGSGKTTLFNCLNEDIKMDGGSFHLREHGATRPLIPEDIGYILSTPVVPEFLTAREFIKFFIDINQKRLPDIKTADEYFDFMMIAEEDRDVLLKDYSHGMKNKMQMLVNFVANPPILLLDEPLTSFDIVVADEIKQLLKTLKKDHIIVFSTHILELAVDLCDEIVILSDGELQEVPTNYLDDHEFKQTIITALKGVSDDDADA